MERKTFSHGLTALLAALSGVTAGSLMSNETPEARATQVLGKRHNIVKDVAPLYQVQVEQYIEQHICPEVNRVYGANVCSAKDIDGANLRWLPRNGVRTLVVFTAVEVPGKWSPKTE